MERKWQWYAGMKERARNESRSCAEGAALCGTLVKTVKQERDQSIQHMNK